MKIELCKEVEQLVKFYNRKHKYKLTKEQEEDVAQEALFSLWRGNKEDMPIQYKKVVVKHKILDELKRNK